MSDDSTTRPSGGAPHVVGGVRNETEWEGTVSASAYLATEAGEMKILDGDSLKVEIAEHTVTLALPIDLGVLGAELTLQINRSTLAAIPSLAKRSD